MLFASQAAAIDPFVIKDIRIEGIQRTEAGTVFSYLPVKVGETMNDEKAAQAIRALFATGFFRDVSLEVEGGVLVVVVQERPSIAQIEFVGLKEFDKDAMLKGMRQVGLAEGRIFDKSVLDRAEQELKRQYLNRGKYAVELNTTVTPLERNRVSINFGVVEGDASKIRQISIIGAKAFREKDLVALFSLSEPGWLTWYSKTDQYSRQKLSADIETLRSYYQDRGYLEFNVDSTQVSITPDKKDIYITLSITEGERYKVSEIKIGGQPLIPEDDIRKLITLKPGDVFSRARLTESTKKISERLSNDGYAFANVNAAPELVKDKHEAAFTFFIDPGRRVYVRRINVAGNSRTRDEVIRREMRQFEGAWYSGDNISTSRKRIDRLGYFTEVNVETPAAPGTTDQVDLNVTVIEKPTGNILLGAGFGSGDGLVLSGAVAQQNIFGSGKHVSAQVSSGRINTVYSLSYTDPYFTQDGVSVGYDVYVRNIDAVNNGLGAYKTDSKGANVRFGVPISELDTINYGLGIELTDITTFPTSPLFYQNYVNTFGSSNRSIPATIGWARESRDSLIYPTSGTLQRLFGEVGLPGGTLRYYKASYQYQQYFPLTRDYTLMWNGEAGYGGGLSGKPLPFFKNFFAGGVNSVRGYRNSSLGPRDQNGDPQGGDRKLLSNAEFLFPFPGLGNDRSARLSAFVDAGLISDTKYSFSDFRYSTGMALLWVSPLGPLKISVAYPIAAKAQDKKQAFQFTFGGVF